MFPLYLKIIKIQFQLKTTYSLQISKLCDQNVQTNFSKIPLLSFQYEILLKVKLVLYLQILHTVLHQPVLYNSRLEESLKT